MASIRCAHCKQTHSSVAEVKDCSTGTVLTKKTRVPSSSLSIWSEIRALGATIPLVPSKTGKDRGRFALDEGDDDIKFYRVSRPNKGKWMGATFLEVQASDDWFPVKNPKRIFSVLEKISSDPEGASKLYGLKRVHCGVCGRKLTVKLSRIIGIGPKCRMDMGW